MDIKSLAEMYPGRLYMQGVAEVDRVLGTREGATRASVDGKIEPRFVSYLLSSFQGRYSVEKMGVGKARELRTLATALDQLGRGEVAQASDVIMQRFKAVTAAIEDGNWTLAQRYELIPEVGSGLIGVHERRLAARDEAQASRLLTAAASKRSGKAARPE